jgi:hypothetical protein
MSPRATWYFRLGPTLFEASFLVSPGMSKISLNWVPEANDILLSLVCNFRYFGTDSRPKSIQV